MDIDITIENDQARLFRCIGEPTRLQILKLLAGGERYVGEIIQALDKEQSLVSHHLKALKDCNIVTARQENQKIFYRLADPHLAELVSRSESLVKELSLCKTEECYERGQSQECC